MKKTASAFSQSPATLLGNRMTGRSGFLLYLFHSLISNKPAAPTDPPTMMASVPPLAAASAILAASIRALGIWVDQR